MTVDAEVWKKRITAARKRREKHEQSWAQYALLHAKSYQVQPDINDDEAVLLPSGDQVRLGLIHSNIEQTLALLEIPELGVKVEAYDYTRELNAGDTHREAVIEQALIQSTKRSGLIKGKDEADYVKRDALIVGHGVLYTHYRVEENEMEIETAPVYVMGEDGTMEPERDEAGEPVLESITEKVVTYEGVEDEHVPVLEFLFDAHAQRMEKARWHGREQIVRLEELRKDPRYEIPAEIEPQAFTVKDLYGETSTDNADWLENDSVKCVVIWDKDTKTLLTFLESVQMKTDGAGKPVANTDLLLIREEPWPIIFSHPDASPFSTFVPIPANDHPFGISQIEHTRNPAVEADKIRTRQANVTREMKQLNLIRKGLVDPDEMDAALKSPDRSTVYMNIPDDFDKNRDIITINPASIPADLYQQEAKASQTVREVSGISEVPFGGASTATESEHMWNIGGARVERKRNKYLQFLSDVLHRHLDFLREFGPDGQAVPVIGDDGLPVLMAYGREALQGDFDITVMPGGKSMAASPVEQKTLIEFSNLVMGKFGPVADRQLLRELGARFGIRGINNIVQSIPAPPMPGMMPAGGMPGMIPGQQPEAYSLDDYTNGQAVRAGVNAPNEG